MKKEEIEFYRNNIFTALRRAKRPLGLDGICRVLFYGTVNDKNRALVRQGLRALLDEGVLGFVVDKEPK